MIGNDIIDLDYTRKHCDWTRHGWIQKIFSSDEQDIISNSTDPFTTVWRMWSMKESVYKLHMRTKQERSFYPSRISCNILDAKCGLVEYEGKEYNTETNIQDEYIYSSTKLSNDTLVSQKIINYGKVELKNHYKIIIAQISTQLDWDSSEVNIVKNGLGIPEVYLNQIKQEIYLSITHHGKYLAYSIAKEA